MASGSKTSVYAAIITNTVVTIAKFAGAMTTGSGAMLAEAYHSTADVGNQTLLALGMRKAKRKADPTHPEGYTAEAFVWSLMSAVGMFFIGAGASIQHGVSALMSPDHGGAHHDPGSHAMVNLGILTFALVAEGICLAIAVQGMRKDAKAAGQGFWKYVRTTDDPFGVAVLLEDAAAVLGVSMALASVGLTLWTGHAWWDAVGTLAIGVLLAGVATFLIAKNRSLLLGRSARPEDVQRLEDVLANDDLVESVAEHRAVVTGVDSYRVTAEVDLNGAVLARKWMETQDLGLVHKGLDSPEALAGFLERYTEAVTEQLGDEIDRIEARIREELPKATTIAIEVD